MEWNRTGRLKSLRRERRHQALAVMVLFAALMGGLLVVDHSYEQMTNEEGKILAAASLTVEAFRDLWSGEDDVLLKAPPEILPPRALLLGRTV